MAETSGGSTGQTSRGHGGTSAAGLTWGQRSGDSARRASVTLARLIEKGALVSVGTAFFPREAELNQHLAWGEWSGYHSAAVYADFHDIEYNAIREAAAVVDVSPLYKYVIGGRDAARLLDRVMTRDVPSSRSTRSTTRPGATRTAR